MTGTAAGYFTNLILSNEEGGKMLEKLVGSPSPKIELISNERGCKTTIAEIISKEFGDFSLALNQAAICILHSHNGSYEEFRKAVQSQTNICKTLDDKGLPLESKRNEYLYTV